MNGSDFWLISEFSNKSKISTSKTCRPLLQRKKNKKASCFAVLNRTSRKRPVLFTAKKSLDRSSSSKTQSPIQSPSSGSIFMTARKYGFLLCKSCCANRKKRPVMFTARRSAKPRSITSRKTQSKIQVHPVRKRET